MAPFLVSEPTFFEVSTVAVVAFLVVSTVASVAFCRAFFDFFCCVVSVEVEEDCAWTGAALRESVSSAIAKASNEGFMRFQSP